MTAIGWHEYPVNYYSERKAITYNIMRCVAASASKLPRSWYHCSGGATLKIVGWAMELCTTNPSKMSKRKIHQTLFMKYNLSQQLYLWLPRMPLLLFQQNNYNFVNFAGKLSAHKSNFWKQATFFSKSNTKRVNEERYVHAFKSLKAKQRFLPAWSCPLHNRKVQRFAVERFRDLQCGGKWTGQSKHKSETQMELKMFDLGNDAMIIKTRTIIYFPHGRRKLVLYLQIS